MYFFGRFLLPVHTLIVIYVCFKSIEAETETSSYSCPGGPQACSWGRQWKGESSSWSAFHCSLSFFAMEQKTMFYLGLWQWSQNAAMSKIFREDMSPAVIFFMFQSKNGFRGW